MNFFKKWLKKIFKKNNISRPIYCKIIDIDVTKTSNTISIRSFIEKFHNIIHIRLWIIYDSNKIIGFIPNEIIIEDGDLKAIFNQIINFKPTINKASIVIEYTK